jgi:RHS repeat-associated protein
MYSPYGEVAVLHGDRDSSGTDTSASEWSARTSNTFENALLYCGYYHDSETGLYHVRYRYYHPPLGRWTSRDPIGYADGMGLYEYGRSHPIAGIDPLGTEWYKPWTWGGKEKEAAKDIGGETAKTAVEELSKNAAEKGKFEANPKIKRPAPVTPGEMAEAIGKNIRNQGCKAGWDAVDAMKGGLEGFSESNACKSWYKKAHAALKKARDAAYKGCDPCDDIERGLTSPAAGMPLRHDAGKCYWDVMVAAGSNTAAKAVADVFKKTAENLGEECNKAYEKNNPKKQPKE